MALATTTPHHTGLPTGTWIVDPDHSSVGFRIKHMGIATVRGEFTAFEGRLVVPADGGPAVASGSVEVASIDTKVAMRDDDLRSANFFDAEHYPQMTFVATELTQLGERDFELRGRLTLRGVTREVTLAVEYGGTGLDDEGQTRLALEAQGEISRRDFGMTYDARVPGGNALVGDSVRLDLEISAVKYE
jgi:polyisoprenoid-binding protein YceI